MITLYQSNTPSETSCENCSRDTDQHYIVEKNDLTPRVACEYCLQEVISDQTTPYFTIESIRSHRYRENNTEESYSPIEPITKRDVVKLVEGMFIHRCSGVDPDDEVFDEISVCEESVDAIRGKMGVNSEWSCESFSDFSKGVAAVESELQVISDDETDDDEVEMIEPGYERQRELIETLGLYSKWDNQSDPAVGSGLIELRISEVVAETTVDESALRKSHDF